MILVAILVPWLSFFLRGKIISGIVCLVLQLTLIGWLPAAIWAVMSRRNAKTKKEVRRLEKKLIESQVNNG